MQTILSSAILDGGLELLIKDDKDEWPEVGETLKISQKEEIIVSVNERIYDKINNEDTNKE